MSASAFLAAKKAHSLTVMQQQRQQQQKQQQLSPPHSIGPCPPVLDPAAGGVVPGGPSSPVGMSSSPSPSSSALSLGFPAPPHRTTPPSLHASDSTPASTEKKSTTSSVSRLLRYPSYAKYVPDGHRPNDLVEFAAPSIFFLTRNAQPAPYVPIAPHKVPQVAKPSDYSLRPQSYVAEQAVMDLYRVLSYGGSNAYVSPEVASNAIHTGVQPPSAVLPSTEAAAWLLSQPQRQGLFSTTPPVGPSSAVPGGIKGLMQQETMMNHHTPASTSLLPTEDYRSSQIKRNARHIDNRYYQRRTCSFYNSKEGCRRGERCEYLHVDKNGTVLN